MSLDEFGQMVKVQEAEGGVITDVGVVEGTDHALLVPSVERHADVFAGVGEAGFEPATTSTQSSCTTGLCDSPEQNLPVI